MTGQLPSLTERLAQHLCRPVDETARTRARLHLLDWLGCVAGARRTESGELTRGFAGEPAVTRAAWLGNVLEMDDVHRAAILHPGPVIWPTVLGDPGAGMDRTLDAAVRGYEATIAIGATFDARHYSLWHNTATAGVSGAAAAAASLLDCGAAETVSAMGLAGSVAGGLWRMRHEPGQTKQWHIAHAVATGGAAARYASAGVTGPRHILEGAQGLYAATGIDPTPLALGDGWRMAEVSFKPWAACRHAHPAIDAALDLRATGGLAGRVRVETYRDALTFCGRPHPRPPLEAKFSIQHAVAVVAGRGEPRLEDFEPAAIDALAGARSLVTVAEGADFAAAYPAHWGARVGGASGSRALSDTRGDPERRSTPQG